MDVRRDFSAKTIRMLARKGVRVVGSLAVPAWDGDRGFSGVAYTLDDNGTHRVLTHREVLALAG